MNTLLDPKENRLTEGFASVLEAVDGLAARLVKSWLDVNVDGPVSVRTQRLTMNGKFVDLELVFGSPAAPRHRVWIEVKHGADLHEDQLQNYGADLKLEQHGDASLVLLAPRASMPGGSDSVARVEWQAVAQSISEFARARTADPAASWLLGQFSTYLKEEGLADEDALTPAHVFALAARPAADRTFTRLVEVAHQYVVAQWPTLRDFSKPGGKPGYGPGWWATFEVTSEGDSPPTWRKSWFEWTLREDAARAEPRDSYVFFAGAAFQSMKESPLAIGGNEAWLAARASQGFERLQAWYWRLWRPLYPEQLMFEATLEGQAKVLAKWVVESFRLLEAEPPPM